ncbi:hypothetical protein ABL78_7523 [Leptomonas seymouri]|uniref:Uncharacterized protein n=1 Tax=Leptomonas seymouri TaxID=5684 RepID=A0A0N0P3A6_LEPSE|nr:hypothetical protein ABL78_7523 [Leptomonas seymouri]|eukprot:KPI83437.1 hypothetical protein ABL78_7523 [Leptomonas seymouri]
MVLDFSKASTQFVRNLVELGVCENASCLNAYHPPAGVQSGGVGTAQRQASLCSVATAVAPSTRPVIAIDVLRWVHALDSDDFPMTEVCHQLSSSELQMSQSLESFIDELFTKVSQRYAVQLETLVRALRLLERVQMANIRTHTNALLSQLSSRSDHSGHAGSFDTVGSSLSATAGDPSATAVTRSQMPTQRQGLLHAAEVLTSQLRPSSADCPRNRSGSRCYPQPNSVARGSVVDGSSVSSDTVGPLTDGDRLSYGRCSGSGDAQTSSLVSWCLPSKPSSALSVSNSICRPNAVSIPLLRSCLQLCAACAGSCVFTLQYYNVHLLLAACLALSISINEMELMEAVTEDALMHQVAEMSHCTDVALQMAVRVVCETLQGELCVFDSDVDVLVQRLSIVERCVFPTEGL